MLIFKRPIIFLIALRFAVESAKIKILPNNKNQIKNFQFFSENNEWLLARLGQGFFESWYMY